MFLIRLEIKREHTNTVKIDQKKQRRKEERKKRKKQRRMIIETGKEKEREKECNII